MSHGKLSLDDEAVESVFVGGSVEDTEGPRAYHDREWRLRFWELKLYLLDTERFVTSYILPTWALLLMRTCSGVYAICTICFSFALGWKGGLWVIMDSACVFLTTASFPPEYILY